MLRSHSIYLGIIEMKQINLLAACHSKKLLPLDLTLQLNGLYAGSLSMFPGKHAGVSLLPFSFPIEELPSSGIESGLYLAGGFSTELELSFCIPLYFLSTLQEFLLQLFPHLVLLLLYTAVF